MKIYKYLWNMSEKPINKKILKLIIKLKRSVIIIRSDASFRE